ncbi:SKI2 [Symbiodinium pilosum]|uniref:SKI2 protein n=1 Tax=Symbiodinium pilosum TaxID=2952 RepID=A0A812VN35_SYMPI|nr:SKI2 [Symbiodinium pilosum]
MAVAGVNVWILLGFVLISYGTAPYVAYAWTNDQLLVCLYVLFAMMLVEHRATLMQSRSNLQQSGYKALISADDPASAHASRGPVDPLSSRFTADTLSRAGGNNSDAEDGATPLPPEGEDMAFLNGLWNRLREQRSTGPISSIFARLTNGQRSVASTSSGPRHRFSADKVQQPGAAVHEAPYFAEREMEFLMQDLESGTGSQGLERRPMLLKSQTNESLGSLPFPGSPAGGGSSPLGRFPNSPAGSITGASRQYFKAVKLGGFQNPHLNVLFVERPAREFQVNERETYWPASGYYFIYRSRSTNTWGIAKAKRFEAVKESKSNGVAHSPEGFELWLEANERQPAQRKNWREWDLQLGKWVSRSEAGVISRGKVRPKVGNSTSKVEVEVQITAEERLEVMQVREAAVQTIARVHQKPADSHGHDASIALSSFALGPSSQHSSPQGKSHHKAGGEHPYRGGSTDTLLGLATESQGVRRPSVRLDSPSPPTSTERRPRSASASR